MRIFGLIGYPLSHSFSKKYFSEKFEKENIKNTRYDLFPLEKINQLPTLIKNNPEICGLNVTIPYKEAVIPFLHTLSDSALQVGAVNVIKVEKDGTLTGYNSDYYGFLQSLAEELKRKSLPEGYKSLVLGTGGASKAVQAALKTLQIPFKLISRNNSQTDNVLYEEIDRELMETHPLIINTSPVGMYPDTSRVPDIPYQFINSGHFLYDLIYNPEESLFLKMGKEKGAGTKNGLEMLYLQAEKAWEIWNC